MSSSAFQGAILFATPDDLMTAMFGPPQHDEHVRRRRHHLWITRRLAALDDADAALVAAFKQLRTRGGTVTCRP